MSDYLLDIVHNSIQAEAETVRVKLLSGDGRVEVVVADDGVGMTVSQVERALDPFYTDGLKHRGRTVGLGLPFVAQAMETVRGSLRIDSQPGEGTTVRFAFDADHVDAPPLGDVVDCIVACLCFDGSYELVVDRRCNGDAYRISRSELLDALGGFADVSGRSLVRRFVESAETETCKREDTRWQR